MPDDENSKKDFTRLEDLPEFNHEDDTGVDRILNSFGDSPPAAPNDDASSDAPALPDMPDEDVSDNEFTDSDVETSSEPKEEVSFDDTDDEVPAFDASSFDDDSQESSFAEQDTESDISADFSDINDEEPSGSEEPLDTEEPLGSEEPLDTEEPLGSEAPLDTEEPLGSEAPLDTEEPLGSEAPLDTEEPLGSEDSTDSTAATSFESTEEDFPEFEGDDDDELKADFGDSDDEEKESLDSEDEDSTKSEETTSVEETTFDAHDDGLTEGQDSIDETDFGGLDDTEDVGEKELTADEVEPEPITKTPLAMSSDQIDSRPDQSAKEPAKPVSFEDVRDFAQNITYGMVGIGGNPPFSIILTKLKYVEDTEDILGILNEHGLINDDNEEDITQSLTHGNLLISQINEYSAIYLAHKFRRFDCNITVGLSDELHPSKSYDHDQKGLVNKSNLYQNKSESFNLDKAPVDVNSIILATTPSLESFKIDQYIDIITEHTIIDEDDLERFHYQQEVQNSIAETAPAAEDGTSFDPIEELKKFREQLGDDIEEDELMAQYGLGLNEIYRQLAEKLKHKAYLMKGNAVVGINYQLTPLGNVAIQDQENADKSKTRYKITCTGNVVLLTDQATQ